MRTAKWCLSAAVGALSLMSVGSGEAWSQNVTVQICNNSGINAWVAVTGHPNAGDARYLISGWFQVQNGNCMNATSIASGWIYLYAESDDGNTYWSGNTQRFCVQYPGPFDRYISDDFNCSGNLLKGFIGYYASPGTFTWTLN